MQALERPSVDCSIAARSNALAETLGRYTELSQDDIDALESLCRRRKILHAGQTLIHEGRRCCSVILIVSGFAYRYKYLADGRRQILGYLLPGDLCDTQFLVSDRCDHSVGVLAETDIALIPIPELKRAVATFPSVQRALVQCALVESSALREWLLNLGQRDAVQRIAHLLCEFRARLRCIGEIDSDGSFLIPITQLELADTVGLTVVHVNRCLQRLREEGLIIWRRGRLAIRNHSRLEQMAEFDRTYLRLDAASPPLHALAAA